MTRAKHFSLRAILVMVCLLLAPSMMWADKEIYVEFSKDTINTLTFRYDENRASSTADTTYSLPASGEEPAWRWRRVDKVVFDASFKEAHPERCHKWFYYQDYLTEIDGIENLNTDSVNDLSYMFYHCDRLPSVDLSHFNTSNVTTMTYMFADCVALTELDLTSFRTPKVDDMSRMFWACSNLKSVDLSTFNTTKVNNMYQMFFQDTALVKITTCDLFVTDQVTSSTEMFYNCLKLPGFSDASVDKTKACYAPEGYFTQALPLSVWVGYDDETKTLTFHNDNTRPVSTVANQYDLPASGKDPGWLEHRGDITKVVFGKGFADVRPVRCAKWFYNQYNLTEIDGLEYLNTSEVNDMSDMFYNCQALQTLDLSTFNTENVTTMTGMFYSCKSIKSLDLSSFRTSKVDNMSNMFNMCRALETLNLSNFDTRNVTTMSNMFSTCEHLSTLDLSSFDTEKVTDMAAMFMWCYVLKEIKVSSSFVTDQVTSSTRMFFECNYLPKHEESYCDISAAPYNLTYVTAAPWVEYANGTLTFHNDTNRKSCSNTSYSLPAAGIEPAWLEHSSDITKAVFDESFKDVRPERCAKWFYNMYYLKEIDGLKYLNTDSVDDMSYMFSECHNLTSLDLSGFNTENVTTMKYMFNGCTSLPELDLSSFRTSKVDDMSGMFFNCGKLTNLDLTTFDTRKVTNMSYMFSNDYSLSQIMVNDYFVVDQVEQSTWMFYNCGSLPSFDTNYIDKTKAKEYLTYAAPQMWAEYEDSTKTLTFRYDNVKDPTIATGKYDLSASDTHPGWLGLDTQIAHVVFTKPFADARPVRCTRWFDGMSNLTDITGIEYLNTDSVNDMSYMYYDCKALKEIDLSHFNTSNVTTMACMFDGCTTLQKIDVSSFCTSKVDNMSYMFNSCKALKEIDLSHFNTSNVTNMMYMFSFCSSLTNLDLTAFDTRKVTNMVYMFQRDGLLSHIYVSQSFSVTNVSVSVGMFEYCVKLPNYTSSETDKTRAHYNDGGNLTLRRYFTVGEKRYNLDGVDPVCYEDVDFTDDELYSSDLAFHFGENATASYTRKVTNHWATLCMPFSFKTDNSSARIFIPMYANDSTLSLTDLTNTEIYAGEPVIVYTEGDEISITATGLEATTKPETKGMLTGVFTKTEVSSDDYIIANDHFWNAGWLKEKQDAKGVYVAPYRAYLTISSKTKPNSISIDEGETDGIERIDGAASLEDLLNGAELYDLQGRRLSAPQRGVMIIRKGSQTLKVLGSQTH